MMLLIGISSINTANATCFIVGDSIAQDLGAQAMRECKVSAKKGISSQKIIARVPGNYYDVIIISSGTNDADSEKLPENLEISRKKMSAKEVIWILPMPVRARILVEIEAKIHGDKTVGFEPAQDHTHPRNNHTLASDIKALE